MWIICYIFVTSFKCSVVLGRVLMANLVKWHFNNKENMKKLLLFLFMLLPMVASLPVQAYDFEYRSLRYNIVGTNSVEVARSPFCSGDIVIPSSIYYNGKTYTVTGIGENAFGDIININSVTIPNSVTYIGKYAFEEGFMTSVTMGNGVKSIGMGAFQVCHNLSSITIPSSVTSIGSGAFNYCSKLKTILSERAIPIEIDDRVFSDYTTQATLFVPSGSRSAYQSKAGWNKFQNIVELEKKTIHVATAGTLPDLIPEDEKNLIAELTLTGELNGTDLGFLREMAGKSRIGWGSGYDVMDEIEGCRIDNTQGNLKILDISNVKIVSGGSAFLSVYLEGRDDLFSSDNIMPNCVFYKCRFTSIKLPESISRIGAYALSGCPLTFINIPEGVASVDYKAFYNCSQLTSITIPTSLTSIGVYAFYGTAWYDNQPDGILYINKIAYRYKGTMPDNTSLVIKDGTLGIADYAFSSCSGLTSLTIPNSVKTIGIGAFEYCSGLTSVIIGKGVTSIGNAFSNCTNLKEMTLSLTAYNNGSLESVTKFTTYSKNPMRVEVVSKGVVSATMKVYPIDEQGNTNESNCYTVTTLGQTPGQYIRWKLDDENYGIISEKTEGTLTLETQSAQPMSTTKARLSAIVNEADDDQHFGFEWLRHNAPDDMQPYKVSAPLYDGRIVGSLSGLNPDVYYKYRPYYQSDSGDMTYGKWITFNTGDANVFFEPEVHTKEATAVKNGGALLSGVWVEGTDDIQEKGFEYWPKSSGARAVSYTIGTNVSTVIVSGNYTSATLKGLKSGVEYGYRSYVKTASKTYYGEEMTFKTPLVGDANNDGKVDASDIVAVVNAKAGKPSASFNMTNADMDGNGTLTEADITAIANIIMKSTR